MKYTATLTTLMIGVITGAILTFIVTNDSPKSGADLIAEYYEIENAVAVSPHGVRAQISEGQTTNFVLVDLRSREEYEAEHIVTAFNIPAYSDANTSAYNEVQRIVSSFQDIIANNPNKDIVVYCYSTACMTGRKIGHLLANHDIYVKHLNIGWNEWKYEWDSWNHDGEIAVNPNDYVISGNEPGVPPITNTAPNCTDGEFGC
ncbi:MAG: rhodanese-like domain-containing protein [Candidatus Paceibacterota bacterium]